MVKKHFAGRRRAGAAGRWLMMIAGLALFAGCERDAPKPDAEAARRRELERSRETTPQLTPLEQFAGKHARVVWAQSQNSKGADPYSSGINQRLMGCDSREAAGARPLLKEKGNFTRPLLSADGERVLFTRKELEPAADGAKKVKTTIFSMAWTDDKAQPLAEGYAVDVWQDAATGRQWVYAVRDFQPVMRQVIEGRTLVRFLLDDPATMEQVWNQSALDPDSVQLSQNGSQASAGIPWPDVGRLRLSGEGAPSARKITTGCWAGISPDNSGLLWSLAEDHLRVHLFDGADQPAGELSLSAAAGWNNAPAYHPRWSNDARFMVFTGPYLDSNGQPATTAKGGQSAEVMLARLAPDLKSIEAVMRLTENKLGDSYPDAWFEGQKR